MNATGDRLTHSILEGLMGVKNKAKSSRMLLAAKINQCLPRSLFSGLTRILKSPSWWLLKGGGGWPCGDGFSSGLLSVLHAAWTGSCPQRGFSSIHTHSLKLRKQMWGDPVWKRTFGQSQVIILPNRVPWERQAGNQVYPETRYTQHGQ